MIRHLETRVLYENPKPFVRSRHGHFPGLVRLHSGDLLALFVIAEAFESADTTTYTARSTDFGRSWVLEGALCNPPIGGVPTSDYMKAAVLRDGSLIAIGYRFHRYDPEQGIGIAETGGLLPGDNIVSFSRDEGRTWSSPVVIARSRPELLELSGPCLQIRSGDLLAAGAPFKLPDGSNPSGQCGILLRSCDGGKTWEDSHVFLEGRSLMPLESRICEMEDGRLVVIFWAYDHEAGQHHPNHVVVSEDGGYSWQAPLNTGHMGQASSVHAWAGNLLLSIHAHRGDTTPGIYIRLVDFSRNCWQPLEETMIYGRGSRPQTQIGQDTLEMFTSLRFGQPSLVRLEDNEFLAVHWCVEDGQGKIRTHRLLIER